MSLHWLLPGGHRCVLGLGLRGFSVLRVGWEHGSERRGAVAILGCGLELGGSMAYGLARTFLASAALVGCVTPQTLPPQTNGRVVLSYRPSVFIRSTFDSDASRLIGLFLPDDIDDADLDESLGSKLRCSEFVKVRKVPAPGSSSTDMMAASSGAKLRLGVNSIAKVALGRQTSDAFIVKYDGVEKLEADITDVKGLEECCRLNKRGCTNRFIVGALMGTGSIYAATEKSDDVGVEGSGTLKGLHPGSSSDAAPPGWL